MARLLVIEQSQALANLLHRTLSAGGFPSVTVVTRLDQVPERLKQASFDAVILGIPQPYDRSAKGVFTALSEASWREVPFLVLVHSQLPQLERYARRRGACEVLPWQRFSRIPALLPKLLPEHARSEPDGEAEVVRAVSLLFVDDSQSARHAYRRLLRAEGFPVDTAASLAEADERLRGNSYDLVIVDYHLPDGTGASLCRRLRKERADLPVAIITGSYRENVIHDCLEAGAVECMFKNEARELFQARVHALARIIETQRSVAEERERLDAILTSVGDGVYGVDQDARITFINPTGLELLGYRAARELVGEPAAQLAHDNADPETENVLAESYATGSRLSGFETVFRRADGEGFPVECSVHPLSIRSARRGSVVVFRNISERKTVEQLQWEVSHDEVTGLYNRRSFTQHLERRIEPLRQEGGYGALLHIDVDRFSDIVDSIGRASGDRVLADIATALGAQLRDNDALARLEADKFALVLMGIQLPNVYTLADGFRNVLGGMRVPIDGAQRELSASIGVVILSRNTPSAEYALEHARAACESAKTKGRNQTHVSVAQDDVSTTRELESGWTHRFKDAIRNDRFVFLAQPILPSNPMPKEGEKRELFFELLLRMVGSDGQWISPGVFVPLAERINMAQELDLWVIRRAAKLLERFDDPRCTVSFTVNLSNVTLQDPATLKRISAVLTGAPEAARRMIFEMTETAELASLHSARRLMQELRKLGCRFALDDFGTGYSSFSHLKHLPVDFIKIDGLFVQSMASDKVDRTVVHSITGMAKALGLITIAEHVDSEDTLAAARASGVDFVQGHLLGEPESIDSLDLEDFLAPA
ncbi:MAG: EAL domain-containing protein [Pseudomonadota bacterium]